VRLTPLRLIWLPAYKMAYIKRGGEEAGGKRAICAAVHLRIKINASAKISIPATYITYNFPAAWRYVITTI
jgi:hypothetical protein